MDPPSEPTYPLYNMFTSFECLYMCVCVCVYLCLFDLQSLERKNQHLRQSEEKVRAANTELCSKMREMIQELDQEKQEAAQR